MKVETLADIKLIGRAIREGWDYDREEVIRALMEVVINRDPELMFEAIDRLQKGDEIQIKRELAEMKKLGDENGFRLRLLELARRIEPAELAKLASENGKSGGAANRAKASDKH